MFILWFLTRLVLDFDLLVYAFGQLPLVVSIWFCMFLSVLVVPYGLFHIWASRYKSSRHRVLRTLLAGFLFLLYQGVVLGFLPTFLVLRNNLPPASRFIIILEQVESHPAVPVTACFTHSAESLFFFPFNDFEVGYTAPYRSGWLWKHTPSSGRTFRGCWPLLKTSPVNQQVDANSDSLLCHSSRVDWHVTLSYFSWCLQHCVLFHGVFFPHFPGSLIMPQVTQYLYFLFAPTLIYRDSYPRWADHVTHVSQDVTWYHLMKLF